MSGKSDDIVYNTKISFKILIPQIILIFISLQIFKVSELIGLIILIPTIIISLYKIYIIFQSSIILTKTKLIFKKPKVFGEEKKSAYLDNIKRVEVGKVTLFKSNLLLYTSYGEKQYIEDISNPQLLKQNIDDIIH
jgi:hypothetical protein